MTMFICYQTNGLELTAQVNALNFELMYFQVSPGKGFPFLMRFDKKKMQWKCVSGIYWVQQETVDAIGKAIANVIQENNQLTTFSFN